MRFLHISDLHLGRRLHEHDLYDDQVYILKQITQIAVDQQVNAVFIAGDVYDKNVPSIGAVTLLDEFLTGLSRQKIQVFLISGNHDSADRLAFGGRLLKNSGVHVAAVFNDGLVCHTLQAGSRPVHIWGLPFVRPSAVRAALDDETIETYTDAVAALVRHAPMGEGTHILLAHQFVTAAGSTIETCDSETISLGTLDNVDAAVFEPFSYVALGHIHTPQAVGRDTLRYCGSPLAYSVSETPGKKSVTVVEVTTEGEVRQQQIVLSPRRQVRRITGTLEQLLNAATASDDYIYARLTDERLPVDAAPRLRTVYPNLTNVEFEALHTALAAQSGPDVDSLTLKSPAQLFEMFYSQVHGQALNQEETDLLHRVLGEEAEK